MKDSQVFRWVKPGDLVVFCSNNERTERIFLRDHSTWTELRGKVLDGEICVVLEVDDSCQTMDCFDIKVLDPRGSVGWTLNRYFKIA